MVNSKVIRLPNDLFSEINLLAKEKGLPKTIVLKKIVEDGLKIEKEKKSNVFDYFGTKYNKQESLFNSVRL